MAEMQETKGEMKLQQLAKMADCRGRVSAPDIDAAWEAFRIKHIDNHNVVDMNPTVKEAPAKDVKGGRLKMWMSAMAGAAAMLICVMAYEALWGEGDRYIALEYDETPRMITLASNGQLADLSGKDSVSFFAGDVNENMAAAGSDKKLAVDVKVGETMQTLSTPRGMDFKITLHDGTEVWLNAESTIEFPTAFTDSERNVNLHGEAYFKVAHNESKPFNVNLGDKTIRVLGTEFNVRNYAAEQSEVVLVRGSVQLYGTNGEREATLTPGKAAVWAEGNEVSVRDADTYSATQWTEGLFYFEEHELGVVLREVGRWYNYGVVFKNDKHFGFRIHYSADRNDDIDHIIGDLNVLCGFKIAIDNKNIVVY